MMHMLRRLAAFAAAFALTMPLAGCAAPAAPDVDPSDWFTNTPAQSQSSETEQADDTGAWSRATAPDYYRVAGKADFTGVTLPQGAGVEYAVPDPLGRAGTVLARIDKRMRDAGAARGRDMPDTIAGWPAHNPKVEIRFASGRVYHGYLYNRSHLLAKSLGGEDSPRNMVTGTRPQNVGDNDRPGGMAYTETLARDWLDAHPDGTVAYKATPHYVGDELLPRTVTVDMLTSDGSIDQHVVVYNAAEGYRIDYANGNVG